MNHTIIPTPPLVMYQKRFVSIHSEDRDITKHPNSAEFDIEIPEDVTNVSSIRLVSWTFPSNYNTFSELNSNVSLSFKFNSIYDPSGHITDNLQSSIFSCLDSSKNIPFVIQIEDGFYNPEQLAIVLANKMNESVSQKIRSYLTANSLSSQLSNFDASGGYTNFRVVYNRISQKMWFGNVNDEFSLLNNDAVTKPRSRLPDSVNWGLPNNLGFSQGETKSVTRVGYSPRFYYGDVTIGDNGYWLMPPSRFIGSSCSYIEAPYKLNIMGPSYFYMELEGHNCVDETSPFHLNKHTRHTNDTTGRVNSSFAKIAVPSTPMSQFFDRDSAPVKIYSPALERVRRLKIKLRYHDGEVVNFGLFDYSFMLEFDVVQPVTINKNLRQY